MHAKAIVTRVLGSCLMDLHEKRAGSLLRSVNGLLASNVASLSAIALGLDRDQPWERRIVMEQRIKSVDRLLGNVAMWGLREEIYRCLARRWLRGVERVLIVVDWSEVTADQCLHLLRASVALEGRSVTLYEEIHPQRALGSARVHERFVKRLRSFLPEGCRPIVMSDAGFHSDWFKLIEAQGWYFVGRVRGASLVCLPREQDWMRVAEVYAQATSRARHLGTGQYTRKHAYRVHFVLARRARQGRHQFTVYGKKRASRRSQKNARREREPWLLACSPQLSYLQANAIVKLYAQRMQIEQAFRDTKNAHLGLGLERSRSRSLERLQMLLLIVHLALFVQRLVGEYAKNTQLELQFMATRRESRREISLVNLGRRIIAQAHEPFKDFKPWAALPELRKQALLACGSFK